MKYLLRIVRTLLITLSSVPCLFAELRVPEIVAATEGEPSTVIEGCINTITGDLIFANDDIVVEGAQPLRLKRIYVSGDGKGYNGGWEFFPHASLYLSFYINVPDFPKNYCRVSEPWGTTLKFIYDCKTEDQYVFKLNVGKQGVGLTNTTSGMIGGKTNLKNNTFSFHRNLFKDMETPTKRLKKKHGDWVLATVKTGNGTLRTYECRSRGLASNQSKEVYANFLLMHEKLPNGNYIHYRYDDYSRLVKVFTTGPTAHPDNPDDAPTYASLDFKYHGDHKKNHDTTVTTSDGRTLHYGFAARKEAGEYAFILHHVEGATLAQDAFEYERGDPKFQPKISEFRRHGLPGLKVHYYGPGNLDIDHKEDLRCECVKELHLPDSQGNWIKRYTFMYDYNRLKRSHAEGQLKYPGCTTIIDEAGNRTLIEFSETFRPLKIVRQKKTGDSQVTQSTVELTWGAGKDLGNLCSKSFYDRDRSLLWKRSFQYDDRGNVLQETFEGAFTGESEEREVKTKTYRYSDDGFNLVLYEEDETGKYVTYTYLPNTDLLTSRLSGNKDRIHLREFYEYNPENILVKEILDDGMSSDKNNLKGVTERKIKLITPRLHHPKGLPSFIEERYLDIESGQEVVDKITEIEYGKLTLPSLCTIRDAQGQTLSQTSYQYDDYGRVKEQSELVNKGQRRITAYAYEKGDLKRIDAYNGKLETVFDYDANHHPILKKLISKNNGRSDEIHSLTSAYIYNHKGQKIKEIDPYGHETTFEYDFFGNLSKTLYPPVLNENQETVTPVEEWFYNPLGQCICHIDPKGAKTTTQYNVFGKPLWVTYPDGSQDSFSYYLSGALKSSTDQDGNITIYEIDFFDHPTKKSVYSPDKKLFASEASHYSAFHLLSHTNAAGATTFHEYNGAGRKVREKIQDRETIFNFDCMDRLLTTQWGKLLTKKEYDCLGRLLEEEQTDLSTQARMNLTTYKYDLGDHCIETSAMTSQGWATTFSSFDGFGRVLETKDPLGHVTKIEYDDTLHLKTTIDPLHLQTIESYDALNRLVKVEKKSSENKLLSAEEMFYDLANNLSFQTSQIFSPENSPRVVTTAWEYDLLKRLKVLTEGYGSPEEKIWLYDYTGAGLKKRLVKPDGTEISYKHDPLGRLLELKSSDRTCHYTYEYNGWDLCEMATDLLTGTQTSREYDSLGLLIRESFANGLFLQIDDYDLQNRRKGITLSDNSQIRYVYDALHLREISRLDSRRNPLFCHKNFYDLRGHIQRQEAIGNIGIFQYSTDLLGRAIEIQTPYFRQSYICFDPVGNLKELVEASNDTSIGRTSNSSHVPGNSHAKMFIYDKLYQLQKENHQTYLFDSHYTLLKKDAVSFSTNSLNQHPTIYQYDPNGNPLETGDTKYTYDALDRLFSVEKPGLFVRFSYDGFHRRVSKTIFHAKNGGWEEESSLFFLYDGQKEIGAVDRSGRVTELRVLAKGIGAEIGAAVAIELDGQIYAPIHDLRGNVRKLLSLSGQCFEKYDYSVFGEEASSPSSRNPWRFCSKRHDDEIGLVYFGQRYYNPSLGRFLTPDPLGITDSTNLYAFAKNNPFKYTDLYGLLTTPLSLPPSMAYAKEGATIGAPIVHGLGNFAIGTGQFFASMGFALASPYSLYKGTFLENWHSLHGDFNSFYQGWDKELQKVVPTSERGITYDYLRCGTELTAEALAIYYSGSRSAFRAGLGVWEGWRASRASLRNTVNVDPLRKISTYQALPSRTDSRELLHFTDTAGKHMYEGGRRIPVHTLNDVIEYPMAIAKDPQGASNAMMYYSQIWKNGKLYNVEVLYDKTTNTISHFRYSRDPMGPLKKISKPSE